MSAPTMILLVDDDTELREVQHWMLAAHGYDVRLAGNGLEALTCLAHGPRPALLITDVSMPVLGGRGLCAAIATEDRWRTIPILLHTGEEVVLADFGGANIRGVLRKPLTRRRYLEEVDALLGSPPPTPQSPPSP